MNTKLPAIIFFALGIIFIVFNKLILAGFQWMNNKIWNEKRRKQFPGFGGKEYRPLAVIVLGLSWIACAIFFWFIWFISK